MVGRPLEIGGTAMVPRIKKAIGLCFNAVFFIFNIVWIGFCMLILAAHIGVLEVTAVAISVIAVGFWAWMWRSYARKEFEEYEKAYKARSRWVYAPGDYCYKINGSEYYWRHCEECWVIVRPDNKKGKTYFKKRFFINEQSETLEDDLLALAAVNKEAAKAIIKELTYTEHKANLDERAYHNLNEKLKTIRELVEE
jgi:hypothetical protein